MEATGPMKVVGSRLPPVTPAECRRRALLLQRQADRLNPYPKARGFVFRAKSWEQYAEWRKQQDNPRLW
ncbi:MAG: hypothetical protein B9S33_02865 [Pedosphaera sp. Tous-C6FEB]|nr:MAG: hypothetical protein B9S33_02865 [Pedosphaera sp. Tous-C6FEB]